MHEMTKQRCPQRKKKKGSLRRGWKDGLYKPKGAPLIDPLLQRNPTSPFSTSTHRRLLELPPCCHTCRLSQSCSFQSWPLQPTWPCSLKKPRPRTAILFSRVKALFTMFPDLPIMSSRSPANPLQPNMSMSRYQPSTQVSLPAELTLILDPSWANPNGRSPSAHVSAYACP